ncbi:MAG: hypothetical protein IT448_08665 [Phycisphaerales bacterium]|nr:hypothetical protein [Phycisphaerales bacterium]
MNRAIETHFSTAERIHQASAEQLLLWAILGQADTQSLIEAELKRRARGEVPLQNRAMRREAAYQYSMAA